MNRHARRAASKQGLAPLGELSQMAAKLQPFLTQIDGLKEEVAVATALLAQVQVENTQLLEALRTQRELYLRLFAQGMGVSLDTIESLAAQIEAQLTTEVSHGNQDSRTASDIEQARDP